MGPLLVGGGTMAPGPPPPKFISEFRKLGEFSFQTSTEIVRLLVTHLLTHSTADRISLFTNASVGASRIIQRETRSVQDFAALQSEIRRRICKSSL